MRIVEPNAHRFAYVRRCKMRDKKKSRTRFNKMLDQNRENEVAQRTPRIIWFAGLSTIVCNVVKTIIAFL
jgi:hypothetical protein